jgi:hypothetical protein
MKITKYLIQNPMGGGGEGRGRGGEGGSKSSFDKPIT